MYSTGNIHGCILYAYNLLKMPRCSSVIMICGSAKLGVQCNKQNLNLDTKIMDLDLGDALTMPKMSLWHSI